jgi:type II secretory ATPase GspE/PulE/Tfp pilus assembly ATPase PilB-like protein
MTAEDPVEYNLKGVNQVQINEGVGRTFAAALRSFLRQDPDVILVGETRDLETAQISIRAALTGHLVFSTLHTNDCPSTIARLLDMGIPPFLVASSLCSSWPSGSVERSASSAASRTTRTRRAWSNMDTSRPGRGRCSSTRQGLRDL